MHQGRPRNAAYAKLACDAGVVAVAAAAAAARTTIRGMLAWVLLQTKKLDVVSWPAIAAVEAVVQDAAAVASAQSLSK